jgi:hypothetical protein
MECVEMQAIELSQKIMGLLEESHSQVAINALDICRVLIREKDFNAISSRPVLFESPQETSQFEREPV